MTRIEKNASVEEELQNIKGEVVREVKHRSRRLRKFFTCSAVILFLVASFVALISWIVAATGFVEIPIMTTLAYDLPVPLREVKSGVPVETIVKNTLTAELTKKLYAGGGELKDRSVNLELSESSITASLRSITENSGVSAIDASKLQVVVEPGVEIEFFAPIEGSPLGTSVVITLGIDAKNGLIDIEPRQVRVGSLEFPSFLLASVLQPLIRQELQSLNSMLTGYARVDSIGVESGVLIISGELSVETKQGL